MTAETEMDLIAECLVKVGFEHCPETSFGDFSVRWVFWTTPPGMYFIRGDDNLVGSMKPRAGVQIIDWANPSIQGFEAHVAWASMMAQVLDLKVVKLQIVDGSPDDREMWSAILAPKN